MKLPKIPLGLPILSHPRDEATIPWIWDGVLVLGATTLLTAPEKMGKTTLLSLLLDRRRAGGSLLDRQVWAGNSLVCTEEDDRLWRLRQPPLDFGPNALFRSPLVPVPTRDDWQTLANDLVTYVLDNEETEAHLDLLVIDTAVRFMPLHGRNKETLRWALAQLEPLLTLPISILIINQSRTAHRPLAAFADIVIEMTMPRGPEGNRRRTISGVGRYPETLQSVTAELNADGTDYLPLPDLPAAGPPMLTTLQSLLSASAGPLTQRELLERWPGEPPSPYSLWRILARGRDMGLFQVSGKGTKAEPLRFAIPPRESTVNAAD